MCLKKLSQSVYTSLQKPDITASVLGWPLLFVEIGSCSSKDAFKNTLRKTVLGLVDCICFYKMCDNAVSDWTEFTFPKCSESQV